MGECTVCIFWTNGRYWKVKFFTEKKMWGKSWKSWNVYFTSNFYENQNYWDKEKCDCCPARTLSSPTRKRAEIELGTFCKQSISFIMEHLLWRRLMMKNLFPFLSLLIKIKNPFVKYSLTHSPLQLFSIIVPLVVGKICSGRGRTYH